MEKRSHEQTRRLVGVALMTAIVIVLQLLGSFIRFGPFSVSLVLVPIVVGAALYGTAAGLWLGLAFGVTVLLSGDAGAFLAVDVAGTIVVVLAKGMAAGVCAGLAYRLVGDRHPTGAVMAAAVACPIANTGVFLLGCWAFFLPTLRMWAEGMGFGDRVGAYMLTGLVGLNFVFELAVDLLLGPTIVRLIRYGRKERT